MTAPRRKTRTQPAAQAGEPRAEAWWRRAWVLAAAGNVLLWAALPPLSLSWLAWLAPVPWIVLIGRQEFGVRRPYWMLWATGVLFWLATLYWLTLPHWATAFGWVALSCYLGFYLPVFVGLSRVGVHSLRLSIVVVVPVVWTGLELARAHLLSGFMMAGIAHTQVAWPVLIQISDLAGAYTVSFVMLLVAACLVRMLPSEGARRAWWPAAIALAAVAMTVAYGQWRLSQQTTSPGPNVALIQGSIDSEMKYDPNQNQRIFDEYFDLSRDAIRQEQQLDLIVWPETMFRYPWFTYAQDYRPAEDSSVGSRKAVENTVVALGVPCLLGVDTNYETPDFTKRFNSALAVDRQGRAIGRYDKCHLVPFGEFVPLAETFPSLYRLTPLPGGLNRGSGPQALEFGTVRYAANICYENTIPHLIRNHVATLRAAGDEPDVLVNLTNDGWFWGSTELDLHLACGVFRAIECRKPFLIAANTGFSAWIDSNGRVLAQGRRRATDLIIAKTEIDSRQSPYLVWGDIPAELCLFACVGLAIVGIGLKRRTGVAPADSTQN